MSNSYANRLGGAPSISAMDVKSQGSDDEDELLFRYNRHKNQRSDFYESLKENQNREAIERLPAVG